MDLPTYIKTYGDAHCAALFDVKQRTVASWRRGENFPRAAKAKEIVAKTDGAVSYDGIFSGVKPAPHV